MRKMSNWTRLYLWISGWRLPAWLNEIFEQLFYSFLDALADFSEDEINYFRELILKESYAARPGREKFQNVRTAFKERYSELNHDDIAIDLAIQTLVKLLQDQRFLGRKKG